MTDEERAALAAFHAWAASIPPDQSEEATRSGAAAAELFKSCWQAAWLAGREYATHAGHQGRDD